MPERRAPSRRDDAQRARELHPVRPPVQLLAGEAVQRHLAVLRVDAQRVQLPVVGAAEVREVARVLRQHGERQPERHPLHRRAAGAVPLRLRAFGGVHVHLPREDGEEGDVEGYGFEKRRASESAPLHIQHGDENRVVQQREVVLLQYDVDHGAVVRVRVRADGVDVRQRKRVVGHGAVRPHHGEAAS